MSLKKTNYGKIIKNQYQFKLRAYADLLNPLILLQLIAIFFSFSGIGGSMKGRIGLEVQYYSMDYVIVFTMIWVLIVGIQLTSRNYFEQTIPFIRNTFTENISNILFLFTLSIIGSVLALLTRYLFIFIVRIFFDFNQIFGLENSLSFTEGIMGILATILFMFVLSSLGYLFGMLAQWKRVFIILIPAFIIGLILLYTMMITVSLEKNILYQIFKFYFKEKIFIIFLLKTLFSAGFFFTVASVLSNRLEVQL